MWVGSGRRGIKECHTRVGVFRSRVLVYSKYGVCITLVYSQDALFVVITLTNCRFCINNKLQMSTHIPGVREISPWGLELRIK